MTWIRHDFERSMNKHLNEEVDYKVDNSGYVRMLNWFKKNTDLLEPHNSGTVSPDSGVKHADKTEALKKAGLDTSFPYGYCYPISQFVFYTLGGYDSDYDLRLIKEIKFEYKGKRGQTTHWFVQHKTNGRIIDLTIEQFDRIPGLDIEDYRTKKGKVEFDHTPPCLQTLKLYDRYREDVEKIPGLEKYWSACNYASERRKGDENKPLEEMYDSGELHDLDEIVRRYWK